MRRIAQISVLAGAALAVWLLLPGGEPDAPLRREAPPAAEPRAEAPAPVALGGAAPQDVAAARPAPDAAGSASAAAARGPTERAAVAETPAPGSPEAEAFRARVDRALGGAQAGSDGPDAGGSDAPVEEGDAWVPAAPVASRISMVDRTPPDAELVDQMVESELPEGSLPPEELAQAREEARERITEEQVLLDHLARQSAGEGASEKEIRDRRNLAQTLLSAQDPTTKDQILQNAADEINAAEE